MVLKLVKDVPIMQVKVSSPSKKELILSYFQQGTKEIEKIAVMSGASTLAASISEDRDSIEEVIEPYLIQIGMLNRTPRGRMATAAAYQHFGFKVPRLRELYALAS